jgi:acyl dehydratase
MALDPNSVGFETQPFELDYDWRTAVLYALGIGAKRDELDYLYEGRGPRVFPTIGVVPAYAPLMKLLERTGGNTAAMVHGAQTIRMLAPLPSEGTFRTIGRVTGVYDLKRLARAVCATRTEVNGVPVCETEWTLIFRDDGGFDGPRPPKSHLPKIGDAQPLFEHVEATTPEQALLYRLSGDTNPLHADPEFAKTVGFEQGPILHGLATFGFVARALVRHACAGNGDRLRALHAAFKKPVWPGDTLRTMGYRINDKIALRVHASDRPEAVLEGWAEVENS